MPNPEIISQSKEPDIDKNNWKILLLGFLIAASGFVSFLLLDKFLAGFNYAQLALFVVVSLVFFVFAVTTSFFVKSEWKLYVISLFTSIAAAAVFYDRLFLGTGVILVAGAAIFFMSLNAGFRSANQFIQNSLRTKFFLTAKTITPKIMMGFLVFAAIVFFGNYFLWGKFTDSLGRTVFGKTLASSEPALHLWFPDSNFNQTVEQFLETIARTQLKKTSIKLQLDPGSETAIDFSQLAPEVQAALLKQPVMGMVSYLESRIGPINEKGMVSQVGYETVKGFVVAITPQMRMIWGLALSVLLFYAARSIAGLLYWIINGFSFMLFKLLIVLGFAYVNVETKMREFVLLK